MKRILSFIALTMFGACALAQSTGITPSVGTTADAVHYRGAWTFGPTNYAKIDLKDSSADSSGYVNTLYVGGLARTYGSAGFNTYGGFAEYEPTKYLEKVLKSTNLTADMIHVSARIGLGSTVPDSGSAYLTGFAGFDTSIAVNDSGTVTVHPLSLNWQNPGIFTITEGFQIYFGGSAASAKSVAQSRKAARMRVALAKLKAIR
jgi:hypothetical protein